MRRKNGEESPVSDGLNMKRVIPILLVILTAACSAMEQSLRAEDINEKNITTLGDSGFVPLVKDNSLEGWTIKGGAADFTVEGGVVTGQGKDLQVNSFLCTDKTYRDFIYAFQFKFMHLEGNSGCMFRGLQRENGRVFGYQCEHDNTKRAWTAGLYDEARRGWLVPGKRDRSDTGKASRKAFTAQGRRLFEKEGWNLIVIQCQGDDIKIWLNGEERVNFTDTDAEKKTAEGFFGLQVHRGGSCAVQWKNLYLKEL